MREVVHDIKSEVRGGWRFRWVAISVAWFVCLLGWGYVFMLPDQYDAEARFFVNTTTRLDEALSGVVVDSDDDSQITLVRTAMLSRPVLQDVARATDLDLRARTPQQKERLIVGLRETVKIESLVSEHNRRNADEGIYAITYRDSDRGKAVAVVDALLENFKRDFVSGQSVGSSETVRFLERQIAQYEEQLERREEAIAEFKRQNVGLLPGEGGGYFERLQAAQEELDLLQRALGVLVDRRQALRAQLSGERPFLGDSETGEGSITTPRTELEERIVGLEDVLSDLMLRFTDRHPDVIAVRSQLDQLYERRREENEALMEAGGIEGVPLADNPVYQELQIALNEINVEVAAIEGQVGVQTERVAELRAKVNVIPAIEAQLADLTRDYDQVNGMYNELRERLEQERIRKSRIGWEGVNFRILDPPIASLEPVAPNRPLLLVLVLLAGLGTGAAVAWLLHQLRPVFVDTRGLMETTGLPVLGSVSLTWLSRHRKRRMFEAGFLTAVALTLVLALVLVLVFQDAGVEAAARVKRMAQL